MARKLIASELSSEYDRLVLGTHVGWGVVVQPKAIASRLDDLLGRAMVDRRLSPEPLWSKPAVEHVAFSANSLSDVRRIGYTNGESNMAAGDELAFPLVAGSILHHICNMALDCVRLRGGVSMGALVILPTYNEVGNLGPLVETITAQGETFNLLIIDDGSPDGTGFLAEHLKAQYPGRVDVMHRQGKLGLATAYLTGFQYAITMGYDYVFEMDADFSHHPRYLPDFISAMKMSGADLVLGSRYVDGGGATHWPWYRRLISIGGSHYARAMLGLSIRDLTGGFKCFRREVLESINLDEIEATGYGFQIEMTYRAVQHGFKVVEIPIIFEDRREGQSKMSAGIFAEALWMVARLRVSEQLGRKVPVEGQRIRS